jgi:hypothetical protein
MHFLRGFRDWCSRRAHCQRERQEWRKNRVKINSNTEGIVWVIGRCLHRLMWFTPPQLAFTLLPEDRRDCFTECYVVGVLIASVLIYYLVPGFWLALLSTYFSASTLIAMLHIVLLQRAFPPIKSAERSLVLFMFNVAQIVVMFATWYHLGGVPNPLEISVLTFATLDYAKTPVAMPVAMAQIATDFVLYAIFLGFLLDRFGAKNGGK